MMRGDERFHSCIISNGLNAIQLGVKTTFMNRQPALATLAPALRVCQRGELKA